jgi:hypothetical protein
MKVLPNLSQKLDSTGTVDPFNASALLQIIDIWTI